MVNAMKQPEQLIVPTSTSESPEHLVPVFTGDVNVFVQARFNHLPSAPHAYRIFLSIAGSSEK
jgi:hypothetical protein